MKMNQAGIDLIKKYEGCSLKAYVDPATGAEPITIGYGHTGGIKLGNTWTQEKAEIVLLEDINKIAEQVKLLLKPVISDNKFSALVCFAYNVGVDNLGKSSLLKLVNASNSAWAANEFVKWNKAAGKVMSGLTARREAEKELFLS